MQSVRINPSSPKRDAPRWHLPVYWMTLAGAWLVFVPNLLNLKGIGGHPWPLWVLSPILGLIALILALKDRDKIRAIIALILGVGAVFIGYIAAVAILGP